MIYQIGSWSLRKQSLIHFGIMVATVLPALLLSGLFPLDTAWGYLAVVGIFLVAGIALWASFYVIFTKLVPRKRDAPRPGETA